MVYNGVAGGAAGDCRYIQVTLGTDKDGVAGAGGELNAGDRLAVVAIGGAGSSIALGDINLLLDFSINVGQPRRKVGFFLI